MLELDDNNALATVKTGNYLLMFRGDWCPLCPPVFELLTELEQEKQGRFQLAVIECGANPSIAAYYGIFGVPTVLAIKDGVVIKGWAGLDDSEIYSQFIDENM